MFDEKGISRQNTGGGDRAKNAKFRQGVSGPVQTW